jgi:hypothetical protein
MNYICNCKNVDALQMLQMKRAPLFALVKGLRGSGLLEDSIHTSMEEHVAMFLHVVGHNQSFRVIHNAFIRMDTMSCYFSRVLYATGDLRDEMIKPPSSQAPLAIQNKFWWMPYFKVNNCTIILMVSQL